MGEGLNIAIFGPDLVTPSSDGPASYLRSVIGGLTELGHRVTYHQPNSTGCRMRRNCVNLPAAKVIAYEANDSRDMVLAAAQAGVAEAVIKIADDNPHDDVLVRELLQLQTSQRKIAYWDIQVPRTLNRLMKHPDDAMMRLLPCFDCIFTDGGGPSVGRAYAALGASTCVPIYKACDPKVQFPAATDPRYWCDVAFVGHRWPDRERRVEEFFLIVAECFPDRVFLLGGDGWDSRAMPRNVIRIGHLPPCEHNALCSSATVVLNISRQDRAVTGYCPSQRLFAAAGAGACVITDQFDGLDQFLEPGREVLVARHGADVVEFLENLQRDDAEMIGAAARSRVAREHTYARRAALIVEALTPVRIRTSDTSAAVSRSRIV